MPPILRPRRAGAAFAVLALAAWPLVASIVQASNRQTAPSAEDQRAPGRFDVRLETSKGTVTIDVHRDWAPRGADRFYTLVRRGYYDNSRLHRVVADRWAQFGVAGDPAVSKAWRERTIPDDPPKQSNVKGAVAFAFAVANGRSTQVFINLRDNSGTLDKEPFAVFGRVSHGMDVVDAWNSEYGETSGGGIRAGKQAPLFDEGNAYLDRLFPRLDRIIRATAVTP